MERGKHDADRRAPEQFDLRPQPQKFTTVWIMLPYSERHGAPWPPPPGRDQRDVGRRRVSLAFPMRQEDCEFLRLLLVKTVQTLEPRNVRETWSGLFCHAPVLGCKQQFTDNDAIIEPNMTEMDGTW